MRDMAAEIFVERRYRTSHHNNILGTRNAEKNFLLGTPKRERGRRKDEKKEKEGEEKKKGRGKGGRKKGGEKISFFKSFFKRASNYFPRTEYYLKKFSACGGQYYESSLRSD